MTRSVTFGIFRLELDERRFLRDGEELPLSPKVFDTLALLVENPGHLVTKDEFMSRLWPDTFVGEDTLAQNISILRKVLSADSDGQVSAQEYIATVPKRGYRFVAKVSIFHDGATQIAELSSGTANQVASKPPETSTPSPGIITPPAAPVAHSQPQRQNLRFNWPTVAIIAFVVAVLAAFLSFRLLSPPVLPHVVSVTQITRSGRVEPAGKMICDGSRIYFLEREGDHWNLVQTSLAGGETQIVPTPFKNTELLDLSPDHANFLAAVRSEDEMPLWAWPVQGGAPTRIGDVTAYDAVWHPDGRQIVFSKSDGVYIADSDGVHVRKFVPTHGIPWGLAWSPDGLALRFSVFPSSTHSSSLWEIRSDGMNLHELLPQWHNPPSECCGSWSQDGAYFFFNSADSQVWNHSAGLWALQERTSFWHPSRHQPFRVAIGPVNFGAPLVSSSDSRRLYVFGTDYKAELITYDPRSKQSVVLLPGARAEQSNYSLDGEWLTYVTSLDNVVWRAKSDGSLRRPLTSSPIQATQPVWSPDKKWIAFVNHSVECENKVFFVSSEGGAPQELFPNDCEQYDPAWSPDGKYLGFARSEKLTSGRSSPSTIELLDLTTHQLSKLLGSDGLRSPSWSPDGRLIAAMSEDYKRLMLFDVRAGNWTEIAQGSSIGGFLRWSRDGSFLYFQDLRAPSEPVYRIRLSDRTREEVSNFASLINSGIPRCAFVDLAPDGNLVTTLLRNHADIYALSLQMQ